MKKFIISGLLVLCGVTGAWAADKVPTVLSNKEAIDLVQTHADYVWTLLAAALVFFMQAGFAMVETGFTRAKNAINIMMKNMMDFAMGSLAFWAIGFGLMFGVSKTGWFGTTGFFLSDFKPGGDPWVLAFWMFQVVFAATAATIVSGAMAERTKFIGYLIYSVVISLLIYPVFGSWAWGGLYKGGGWLEHLGFIDFRRIHGRPFGGRMGILGRNHCIGTAYRQIRERRNYQTDFRPQHSAGGPGCIYPLAGLVRFQPRFHDGRKQRYCHDFCQYQPGCRSRCHFSDDHSVD